MLFLLSIFIFPAQSRANEAGSPSGLPLVFRTGRHCTIRQIQIIPQNHNTTVTSSLPRHHLRYPFVTAARAAVVHVGNIVIFPAQFRASEAGSPNGLPPFSHAVGVQVSLEPYRGIAPAYPLLIQHYFSNPQEKKRTP